MAEKKSPNKQKYTEDTIRTSHSLQRLVNTDDGKVLMEALDTIFGMRHTPHNSVESPSALVRIGEMNVLVWIEAMCNIANEHSGGKLQ